MILHKIFEGVAGAMRMHSQLDEGGDTQVAHVIIQYPRNICACGRQLRLRPGGNGRSRGRPLLVATDDGLQCAIEIVKACNDCKRKYIHNYYDEDVGIHMATTTPQ